MIQPIYSIYILSIFTGIPSLIVMFASAIVPHIWRDYYTVFNVDPRLTLCISMMVFLISFCVFSESGAWLRRERKQPKREASERDFF